MALALASTNRPVPEGATTACACGSSSFPVAINDHEPWGAFDYARSIADEHQNPAVSLPVGGNLPARAFIGCARLFHSVRTFGANRSPAQSLPYQLFSQSLADRLPSHRQPLVNVRLDEKHPAREDFQIAGNFFQKRARENAC